MPAHLAILAMLLAAPALAERPATLHSLPEPAGLGRLLLPPTGTPHGLIILLPDALGDDGRAEPYAEALAARGVASLVLGLAADAESPGSPAVEPAALPAAVLVGLRWAALQGFALDRIGLLGFGRGGRSVLAASHGLPGVALYPGCVGLTLPADINVLLLHGAAAPDAPVCATLPGPAGLRVEALPGLGHAWDAPGMLWPEAGLLLPNPAGGPRLRAQGNATATIAIADWVAQHLAASLGGHRQAGR